jgi:hypothetical protein
MDLNSVLRESLEAAKAAAEAEGKPVAVEPKPEPGPEFSEPAALAGIPADNDGKADQFYTRLTRFIEEDVCSGSPPIRRGFIRASSLSRVLESLPMLRQATSFDVFQPMATKPKAGEQATYDIGHAVHWWFQNKYLGPSGMLWGEWKCRRCSFVYVGLMPTVCSSCAADRSFLFEESWIGDAALRYLGHPDGHYVEVDDVEPTSLIEIKTIASSGYTALRAPKHEHLIQVHAYMRAPHQFSVRDGRLFRAKRQSGPMRGTYFIYVDKGKQCTWKRLSSGAFISTSPPRWKIYYVPYSETFWGCVEDELQEVWRIYDSLKTDKTADPIWETVDE